MHLWIGSKKEEEIAQLVQPWVLLFKILTAGKNPGVLWPSLPGEAEICPGVTAAAAANPGSAGAKIAGRHGVAHLAVEETDS